MYKSCNLSLIEADYTEKSSVYKSRISESLGLLKEIKILSDDVTLIDCSPNFQLEPTLCIAMHMYVTSDDKIENGDWFLIDNNIYKCKNSTSETIISIQGNYSFPIFYCKRIIATSNKYLGWKNIETDEDGNIIGNHITKGHGCKFEISDLPLIPLPFIKQYINEHNSGTVFNDVNVEYKAICSRCHSDTDECFSAKECSRNSKEDIYQVEIFPDNTINIHHIKETYTRNEMIDFVTWYSGMSKEKVHKQLIRYSSGLK